MFLEMINTIFFYFDLIKIKTNSIIIFIKIIFKKIYLQLLCYQDCRIEVGQRFKNVLVLALSLADRM